MRKKDYKVFDFIFFFFSEWKRSQKFLETSKTRDITVCVLMPIRPDSVGSQTHHAHLHIHAHLTHQILCNVVHDNHVPLYHFLHQLYSSLVFAAFPCIRAIRSDSFIEWYNFATLVNSQY